MFKLSRRGKTKQPTYRLVVVDKRKDPWGMVKEDVGSYNPHNKKAQFKVERIKYWISKGAQPSASVHNLLVKEKILEAPKKKIKMKVKKTANTEAQKETKIQNITTAETQNENEAQKKNSEIQNNSEVQSSQEKAETPKTEEPKTETPKTKEKPKEEAPKNNTSTPVS